LESSSKSQLPRLGAGSRAMTALSKGSYSEVLTKGIVTVDLVHADVVDVVEEKSS
jgi:hypothetical protein